MTRWRDTGPTRKRRVVVLLYATSTCVTNEWRGPAGGAVKVSAVPPPALRIWQTVIASVAEETFHPVDPFNRVNKYKSGLLLRIQRKS